MKVYLTPIRKLRTSSINFNHMIKADGYSVHTLTALPCVDSCISPRLRHEGSGGNVCSLCLKSVRFVDRAHGL